MRPLSVLFVDDDANILASLGGLVRTRDWVGHFAVTPAQALEILRKRRDVGVIVSDYAMPGMSGIELLGRCRELRPEVQRVLLTGHADAGVLMGAINTGAVFRFVAKPWNVVDLLQAVEAALGQAELLRENRRLRLLTRRRNRQLQSLNASLEDKVEERTRRLAEANVRLREAAAGLVRLLAVAAEGGDPDLGGRGEAVARHAVAVGRRMGLGAAELDDLRMAAMLRDVGRIGAPHGATAADCAERGARLLEPLPFSPGVVAGVRHCTERWDGRGGPCALEKTDIPRIARIVAVATAYEALVHGRGPAPAVAPQQAVADLICAAGRVHDPDVVAALMSVVEEEGVRSAERETVGAHA